MNTLTALLAYETPAQNYFIIPVGEGFKIYYYAVCIVLGILVATCFTALLMHRRNVSTDAVLLCFIVCVPCAIVGARVYSCVSEGLPVAKWFAFDSIRNGGLSIMGGIFGGAIGAGILCTIKRWNFLRIADCILPTFPLAQAIGRWGNYFNQEVYGRVVENSSLQFFPFSVFIEADGKWHYAFFFYESIVNFLWFIVLFALAWNILKKPNGVFSGLFFTFYGLLRAVMEPLRATEFQYGGGEIIDSSLVAAYVLIVAGVMLIAIVLILNKKKEGKIFGSAYGDEYVLTSFLPSSKGEEPVYTNINYATRLLRGTDIAAEKQKRTKKEQERTGEKR